MSQSPKGFLVSPSGQEFLWKANKQLMKQLESCSFYPLPATPYCSTTQHGQSHRLPDLHSSNPDGQHVAFSGHLNFCKPRTVSRRPQRHNKQQASIELSAIAILFFLISQWNLIMDAPNIGCEGRFSAAP